MLLLIIALGFSALGILIAYYLMISAKTLETSSILSYIFLIKFVQTLAGLTILYFLYNIGKIVGNYDLAKGYGIAFVMSIFDLPGMFSFITNIVFSPLALYYYLRGIFLYKRINQLK